MEKNKKKRKVVIGIVVVLVIIMHWVLSNVIIWSGVYFNTSKLTSEENAEIKKLVLNAVKDRCSNLYDIDKAEIYDANASDMEIIQYYDEAQAEKSWFCLIDPFFMNKVSKENENEYRLFFKVFYPESCYYEIRIQKDSGGDYIITFFGLDI